jgi:hypothetical protein
MPTVIAAAAVSSSSVVFPTPGSPRSTSAPLKPSAVLASRPASTSRSVDRPTSASGPAGGRFTAMSKDVEDS